MRGANVHGILPEKAREKVSRILRFQRFKVSEIQRGGTESGAGEVRALWQAFYGVAALSGETAKQKQTRPLLGGREVG
jgi:hypothetical protein